MDRIFYDNQEYAKYSDKFLKRFNLADQAAYDALPAATKNDDSKVFFIPDIPEHDYIYKWDFTKSLVDEIQGSAVTLGANAVRTSSGVSFTGKGDRIIFDTSVNIFDRTIEIDIANCDFKGNTSYDMNFLIIPTTLTLYASPLSYIKSLNGWGVYNSRNDYIYPNTNDRNYFNNGTIKIIMETPQGGSAEKQNIKLYFNNNLVGGFDKYYLREKISDKNITIGSSNNSTSSNGDQCYDMTITGVRIYANEEV